MTLKRKRNKTINWRKNRIKNQEIKKKMACKKINDNRKETSDA